MWTDFARAKYARPAKRYATDLTDAEWAIVAPLLPRPDPAGRSRAAIRCARSSTPSSTPSAAAVPWRLLPADFPPWRPSTTICGRGAWTGRGRPPHRPARAGAHPARARPRAERRHRRQPVGQDHRRRRAARLRRRQEAQGPQAPPARRHARAGAAGQGTRRRHPGPRRAGPAADALPPPLSLPQPAVRRRRLPGRRRALAARRSGSSWPSSSAPTKPRGFVVLPKRWLVERSFAWFGRNRRLAKDFETLIASSTAMLYLAATRLLTRRLATP